MTNPLSQSHRATNRLSDQIEGNSLSRSIGLEHLSSELLMKIAAQAKESIGDLRLTCQKIDLALRTAVTQADYRDLSPEGASNQSFFYFDDAKFPNVIEINFEKRASHLEQPRLDNCYINDLPIYSRLKKLTVNLEINLNDKLFHTLLHCTHLTALYLHNCSNISNNAWLNLLKTLTNLRELDLSEVNFIKPHDCLIPLTQLSSLRLYSSPSLTDIFLQKVLQNAPELEDLEINDCDQITSYAFSEVILHKLRFLEISSDAEFEEQHHHESDLKPFLDLLQHCKALTNLALKYWKQRGMPHPLDMDSFYFKISDLQSVTLGGVELDEWSWLFFCADQVKYLTLFSCQNFNLRVEKLINGLPKLETLNIESSDRFSDDAIASLVFKSLELKKIKIIDSSEFSMQWLSRIDFPQLRSFHLEGESDMFNFKPTDLDNFSKRAPRLKKLFLKNCSEESFDDDLGDLTGALQNLKTLYIHNIDFTNRGLIQLAAAAHHLEKITLSELTEITDRMAFHLINSCPNLKEIQFDNCPRIKGEVIAALDDFLRVKKAESQSA